MQAPAAVCCSLTHPCPLGGWWWLQVGRKYQVALASTLNPDGQPGSVKYDAVRGGGSLLGWGG